jgi:hypothetical protein
MPLHRKLGYDHMMEMRAIERELRLDGLDGTDLYFEAIRLYAKRHENDPSYRQRQEAARSRGEKWVGSASLPHADDLLRKALEEIRDGHNDPRTLAREVLAVTGQ